MPEAARREIGLEVGDREQFETRPVPRHPGAGDRLARVEGASSSIPRVAKLLRRRRRGVQEHRPRPDEPGQRRGKIADQRGLLAPPILAVVHAPGRGRSPLLRIARFWRRMDIDPTPPRPFRGNEDGPPDPRGADGPTKNLRRNAVWSDFGNPQFKGEPETVWIWVRAAESAPYGFNVGSPK